MKLNKADVVHLRSKIYKISEAAKKVKNKLNDFYSSSEDKNADVEKSIRELDLSEASAKQSADSLESLQHHAVN